jgi:hypothetical protein
MEVCEESMVDSVYFNWYLARYWPDMVAIFVLDQG